VKIDAHSYMAFRKSIRGDRLIKLINLMLRSAECGEYLFGWEKKGRLLLLLINYKSN
jgi:hypothetical protein